MGDVDEALYEADFSAARDGAGGGGIIFLSTFWSKAAALCTALAVASASASMK